MKIGLLGKHVIVHLTADQQSQIGGNHVPNGGNIKVAAGTIVADFEPENTKPHKVNIKVHGDSRDDLWVTSAEHGKAQGQYEFPIEVIMETEGEAAKVETSVPAVQEENKTEEINPVK